jgi:hypothetical protein
VPAQGQRTEKELEDLAKASGHRFLTAQGLENTGSAAFEEGFGRASAANPSLAVLPGFERLKDGQKRYLLEIERMVAEAPERPSGQPVEAVGSRALQDLGATDAQIVLYAASVAKGSLDYWRVHAWTWEDAVGVYTGGSSKLSAGPGFWKAVKKIVLADLEGAVGGALGAAATGGNKDAVVGGAIGGAIGESVKAAFDLVSPTALTAQEVGQLHNQLLEEFYRLHSPPLKLAPVTFAEHVRLTESLGSTLGELTPRSGDAKAILDRGNASLQKMGLFPGGVLKPGVDVYKILVSDLAERKEISGDLANELFKIQRMAAAEREPGSRKVLEYINRDFATRNWRDNDRRYAEVFVAVARSSAVFWQAHEGEARLKPGSSTIIADAAGALWGMLLGPVGSIVYGAAFSLYDNEVLN